VSAARPSEIGHVESTALLAWVRNTRPRLFLPALVMAEVAAALSRTGSTPGLAQQYALAIGQLPTTVMVALDEGLARQAAALGAQHKWLPLQAPSFQHDRIAIFDGLVLPRVVGNGDLRRRPAALLCNACKTQRGLAQ